MFVVAGWSFSAVGAVAVVVSEGAVGIDVGTVSKRFNDAAMVDGISKSRGTSVEWSVDGVAASGTGANAW